MTDKVLFSSLKVGSKFNGKLVKVRAGPAHTDQSGGSNPVFACKQCGEPASRWRNAEDTSYTNERGGHTGIHVCLTMLVEV